MTANPLARRTPAGRKSKRTAAEWAASARLRGLTAAAEEWDRADREGWDAIHYEPSF